jgi:hypothetical protein
MKNLESGNVNISRILHHTQVTENKRKIIFNSLGYPEDTEPFDIL